MKNQKENKDKPNQIVIPISNLELSQLKDGTVHNWKTKDKNGNVVELMIVLDTEGNWGY
mgnify:FL=1